MASTPPHDETDGPAVDPLPVSAEHLAAAFAAVVLAMAAIIPDNREQAQRLHDDYLTARGVAADDIAAHWGQFGGKYPE